jgi:hypothetical protein
MDGWFRQRDNVVGACTVSTPSTTSGVASNLSSERAAVIHCSEVLRVGRREASGLYR